MPSRVQSFQNNHADQQNFVQNAFFRLLYASERGKV